jgi:hypothetical protein
MQLLILFFPPLLLYVFTYHLFIPMLPYAADEVPIRPELSSPQLLLYLRAGSIDFSRRYTLYGLYNLLRTVHRHTLHQKMHVVFVCPYLQKRDFIPPTDFQTNLFELLVYFKRQYRSSVLCWTYYVIEKYRNIMALMNESAHSYSIVSQQAAGN